MLAAEQDLFSIAFPALDNFPLKEGIEIACRVSYSFLSAEENLDKIQLKVFCVPTEYVAAYEREMRWQFPAGTRPLQYVPTGRSSRYSTAPSQPASSTRVAEPVALAVPAPSVAPIPAISVAAPSFIVRVEQIPNWSHMVLELDRTYDHKTDKRKPLFPVNA